MSGHWDSYWSETLGAFIFEPPNLPPLRPLPPDPLAFRSFMDYYGPLVGFPVEPPHDPGRGELGGHEHGDDDGMEQRKNPI